MRLGAVPHLMLVFAGTASTAGAQVWTQHGPRPNTLGQVEAIANLEVAGAVNVVAPHPRDANILYVGAVNGGVWRTTNATAATPSWTELLGNSRSLTIGALTFDPTDASGNTLVVAHGEFSSFGVGGERDGVWRTTDGGANWQQIGGALVGVNVTGILAQGPVIVLSSDRGIWRTANGGAAWRLVSGAAGSGLPAGVSFDLDADPANAARLFTNAGTAGIYRSDDTGATWAKVSSAAIDQLVRNAGRVEMAAGPNGSVFAAIVVSRRLAAVFRSADSGGSWRQLDLPETVEDGRRVGIHVGSQGELHLSLAADRNDANVVYIGGDRQPYATELTAQTSLWPNSIGARDFSGRLFRINAGRPAGSQAEAITHVNTSNGSAPHADSRDMAIDAAGNLIEANDGGVYRRTAPKLNTGDWFSLNGDLQITEVHSVAWDAVSNIAISGAQDTGTPQEFRPTSPTWQSVSTGDGGDVAVDDRTTPGMSVRYSSFQYLSDFRRETFDGANTRIASRRIRLSVLGNGRPLSPQFYTPIQLNSAIPTRMIIGGRNGVYESLDRGDTMTEIAPGIQVNGTGSDPIAYGARDNADVLYLGAVDQVYVRRRAGAPIVRSQSYPGTGTRVQDAVVDPDSSSIAFVATARSVFMTRDTALSWANITGDLQAHAPGDILALALSVSDANRTVIVGTTTGVFASSAPAFGQWRRVGTGLPRVPVFDLAYSAVDHILVAGTLGRGTWSFRLRNNP